jgi:FMN-dependent NADH-azoreductase
MSSFVQGNPMTHVLEIRSSLFGEAGNSSKMAGDFVAAIARKNPLTTHVVRDFATSPLPHLDAARFGAFITPPENRTPEQVAVVAESDALIAELRQADVIVIGLPMYNFSLPSQLKSYFDHIARAGVTFKYTESGAQGLIEGKKCYIFCARGGIYKGTPMDTQTSLVTAFLGLIGITDVVFVYAEGLNYGPDVKTAAMTAAGLEIGALAA